MRTAVQLRIAVAKDGPRSDLLWGTPEVLVTGSLGPIAVYPAGEVAAYRICHLRRTSAFVFRTLDRDDRFGASLPGVRPRVQLLIDVRSAGRARLVRGLFVYLAQQGYVPSHLPDDFYARVGAVLSGRLSGHKILRSLLSAYERVAP